MIFPHIFKSVTEIVKYCDVYQHTSLYKLKKSEEPLHAIPVPLKIRNKIGIDLLGPLKEIDGFRYIITADGYTSKFVEAVIKGK